MIFPGQPARRRHAGWLFALAALVAVGGAALRAQADGIKKWGPFSVGGYIYASPAIGPDGVIYVGVAHNTTPSRGSLFAIYPETGQIKWQSALLPDWVESSPVVSADGTMVFVGCDDGKLYAFDANNTAGRPTSKWQVDTGVSIFSSPAIGPDGTIYVGGRDSALHAISPSGTPLWTYSVGGYVDSSPAVAADGMIYFGSLDKKIYAIKVENGVPVEKWHRETGAEVLSSPAIGADGTVYVGSSDKKLYAITPEGAVKWTFPADGPLNAAPVLAADGTIYVGSDYPGNIFYAINPDGTFRWSGPSGKAIVAAAAVRADGTVTYGSYDGVLRAFTLDSRGQPTIKWAYSPESIPEWRSPIESAPAIGRDGTIFFATADGRLYALYGNGSPLSSYSSWPMFRRDARHSATKPPPPSGGQLLNLSTRAQAGDGSNLIAGLFVVGDSPKKFLLRGIGPTLEQYNVTSPMGHPKLELYTTNAIKLAENDTWGSDGNATQLKEAFASVGAFPLPDGSKDAALLPTLVPGPYTAVIKSADGGSGVALVEAYDAAASSSSARLINLSTRGRVVSGGNVIPGLYVGGGGSARLLIRAAGPGLTAFGVEGVLARPTMTVFNQANGALLGSNTGWTTDGRKGDLAAAMQAVGAFPFADDSADCAVLLTLNSGSYTIPVAGVGGTTGEVLVEVYVVP